MAGAERGLEDPELVRVELPLYHRFSQPEGAVDEDHLPEAAVRIEREHDAGGGTIRDNHLLHRDGQQHREMIEAVLDAVHDGAVGEDRGEAAPAGGEQRGIPANAQVALMLSGEARLREILGRRAGPNRHRHLGTVLPTQYSIGGDHLVLEPWWPRRRLHEPAKLCTGSRDRSDVFTRHGFEDRSHVLPETVGVEQRAIGVGRDGKPVGDADACRAKSAIQRTERGRLAADEGDVSRPQVPEPANVGSHGFSKLGQPFSSPKTVPMARAAATRSPSGFTSFGLQSTSAIVTRSIRSPLSAAMTLESPWISASTAATPKRVASIRSNGVGEPPRCT